jgi:hypothetical protein
MARLSDVPIGPLAPILPFPGTSDKLLSLELNRSAVGRARSSFAGPSGNRLDGESGSLLVKKDSES